MATFNYSFPKYPNILKKLFSMVMDVPYDKLSYNMGVIFVIENKKIIDEPIQSSIMIHWLDACIMIINELSTGDEDIDEFGHTLLQAFQNGDYDITSKTLYPEQHLMALYKRNVAKNII